MAWRRWFADSDSERLNRAEVRIADLQRQVTFLLDHQGLDATAVPGPDLTAVRRHLAEGRKIDAIKAYRAFTGAGLAEAKAVVETLEPGAGA